MGAKKRNKTEKQEKQTSDTTRWTEEAKITPRRRKTERSREEK